ncbi:hypothetical protein [Pyrococcus abyssi]|uniref:Uncharacterized protein n=1 Tax=Pyrococcus abyssi (strain GE5 / Orsay) TaxID=272844 RepID=Q9UZT6_PYRAB|nr:hypothetical protein [Pyrococcus abyssi]CAB49970.1 Hypothetical protein PAB0705 [Pyrococcus abyssi GE5]CCE70470.1 TPA: hypothetical protein PAB0705 [Pyrococcus abyssi GE5]
MELQLIIGYSLLLAFFFMKALISLAKLFISVPVRIFGGVDVDKRFLPSLIFNIVTIIVGALIFFFLFRKSLIGAFLLGLSFRSGANFGKFIAYSAHDIKLLKEGKGIFEAISLTLLLLEFLFLLSLTLISQSVYATLKGISLPLLVWFSGLAFGLTFGLAVSKTSKGFLMKDSIALLLFLGVKKVKKRPSLLRP